MANNDKNDIFDNIELGLISTSASTSNYSTFLTSSNHPTSISTPTLIEQILTNEGLFNYISNVYLFTGIGWCCVLLFSQLLSLTINSKNSGQLYIVYIVFGFGFSVLFSLLTISISSSVITDENKNHKEVIPPLKILMFSFFSFSLGMLISPCIYTINQTNQIIFPLSICITTFIFGFIQYYTSIQKNLDDIKYYVPLMSCVSGLILIGIIEIILALLGYDTFVCLISFVITFVSIIVFTGLIYVDTLRAIDSYNKIELDAIGCAINLILDLINILLDIIKILSKSME